MKIKALLAVLMFAVSGALHGVELPWQFEYDKALEEAKSQQKPVLLDFTASWCGPCRMMETTTFADRNLQAELRSYTLVKIDMDSNPELVGKYAVRAIPACIVLNQFGEKVAANVGYMNASAFSQWLAQNKDGAFAPTSKNQALANRMKPLADGLASADVKTQAAAVTSLLNIYCLKDAANDAEGSAAKMAEAALKGFVQRHPESSANYLNDERLAVRILFAALLTEKTGADFPFDPWDKSEARAASAERWAKQIERSGRPALKTP
jgi:thiol-disulfide isomerase/thioredoxin